MLYPGVAARRAVLRRRERARINLLDTIVSRLAEDPRIRVDEFEGVFTVDRRSDLFRKVMLDGNYEPELVRIFRAHVDTRRDVIDVGANVGFFSVLAAKLVDERRVLSVEPTANAAARLRRNLEMNGVAEKVIVCEVAASSSSRRVQINYVEGMEEYSSLGHMVHPSIANRQSSAKTVEAVALDDLVSRHGLDPGLMKVDVEGMEHLVFDGATTLLSKFRPVIVSELSDMLLRANGSSAAEVVERIKSFGYDVTDPISPQTQPGLRPFGDILCIPRP